MHKKALEFSFSWIFATIIGAAIISLAVYAAIQVAKTTTSGEETKLSKQLTVLFEPLETKTASGLASSVKLSEDVRIRSACETGLDNEFGKQKFQLMAKAGITKKWSGEGGNASINHKYIFLNKTADGKKFYFFTKPFNMPFKVANLVYLTSDRYCFVIPAGNQFDFVGNEIEDFKSELDNIKLVTSKAECERGMIKVCFGTGSCDIAVTGDKDKGIVKKTGKPDMNYVTESLMYAAIFSDYETYTCNVERLMKRLKSETNMYVRESQFLSGKCGSIPISSLINFGNNVPKNFGSGNIAAMNSMLNLATSLEEQNQAVECGLW